MQFKTLVFDFDGTIADTLHLQVELANEFLRDNGRKEIGLEEVKLLRDKTALEVISYFKIPIYKVPRLLLKAKRDLNGKMDRANIKDGVLEVLKKLKGTEKTLGIISTNSEENISHFLKKHDINVFDFVLPNAPLFGKSRLLKKLVRDVRSPGEILYIGDEVRDIQAAKKAGVKIAAVTWGANSEELLKENKPDFLLSDPLDLLRF